MRKDRATQVRRFRENSSAPLQREEPRAADGAPVPAQGLGRLPDAPVRDPGIEVLPGEPPRVAPAREAV